MHKSFLSPPCANVLQKLQMHGAHEPHKALLGPTAVWSH